ncbi:hypothetical protein FNU79_16180 [Deinococcus detaillensis]|uniref:TtsA-like Glycoside hydrolase family 108 domain-containing protein n=1 Tax=Deinococcus detaillensis TaxID=2592048 RepID=A0A553UKQ9_9DEIO|nr:glycosyl hydrolase 108 family protein [Deinococcus detaillensis]TSA80780.1 hypothetical protein FNU79_16180 [Deinococcus detaillensis]
MNGFNEAFEIVIGHEGGYGADPRDRGNWTDGAFGQKGGILKGTKYGVAAHAYPTLDIRNLTLEDARAIYKQNYWDRAACDHLPPPLALVVFDTAINSGVSRALGFLAQTKDWVRYLDLRLQFLQSLTSWKTFGKGWQRRVNTLRTQAQQWQEAAAKPTSPPIDVSFPPAIPPITVQPNHRVMLSERGAPFQDVSGSKVTIQNSKAVVINATGGDTWIRVD